MLGIILPIVVAIFIYRAANENGKNGLLWGVLSFVAFFATQFIVQFLIAITMGIVGATSYGMSGDEIERWINGWSLLIALAGALVSWPVVYLIYRYAIHVPDSTNDNLPPPPPKF